MAQQDLLPPSWIIDQPQPKPHKVQSTRYLKTGCTHCDWQARVTRKHLGMDGGVQRTLNCPVPMCLGELVQR